MFGVALLGTLTGCVGYVDRPRAGRVHYQEPPPVQDVYLPPPVIQEGAQPVPVEVVIRSDDDFYEPLRPYGRWQVVGTYGRCWIPGRVDSDWRPYSNGSWERTDAGWYWVSDEPWGWATYHYGRWDFTAQTGWYWVPQTQWAPAWVSWHEGGGYVGWAPLPPAVTISVNGYVGYNESRIAPRAYVFVEQKRFLQPVRPATVVVNNTTIINKTVSITNVKVVNNTVINEGPRTRIIEQASGQTIRTVPVRELRRKQEAEVITRERMSSPGRERKQGNVQAPGRNGAQPGEASAPANVPPRARAAGADNHEPLQRNARDADQAAQAESQRLANDAAVQARADSQRNTRELEMQARQDSKRRAQETEAITQKQSQQNARDANDTRDSQHAAQADAQRKAREATVKAQGEARNQAAMEKDTRREAQQRSQDLEQKNQMDPQRRVNEAAVKAQAEARNQPAANRDAQRAAQPPRNDLKRLNQTGSQRSINEAAAKAQAEARIQAAAERAAQREAQQRSQDSGRNVQAAGEPKTPGRPDLRPKRGQITTQPDGTNSVNNARKIKGKGKPTTPDNPPTSP